MLHLLRARKRNLESKARPFLNDKAVSLQPAGGVLNAAYPLDCEVVLSSTKIFLKIVLGVGCLLSGWVLHHEPLCKAHGSLCIEVSSGQFPIHLQLVCQRLSERGALLLQRKMLLWLELGRS